MKSSLVDGNVNVIQYDDDISRSALNELVDDFNRVWCGRRVDAKTYACDVNDGTDYHRVEIHRVRKTDKANKIFDRFIDEIRKQQIGQADLSDIHIEVIVGVLS